MSTTTRRNVLSGALGVALLPLIPSGKAHAFIFGVGGSTEFTQILNNIQLIGQVSRQAATASAAATSAIEGAKSAVNTFRSWELMIDNIRSLPDSMLSEIVREFQIIWNAARLGEEITMQQMASDTEVRDRYWDSATYRASGLDNSQIAQRLSDNRTSTADSITSAMRSTGLSIEELNPFLDKFRDHLRDFVGNENHTELFQGMILTGQATVEGLGNLQRLVAEQSRLTGAFYKNELEQKAVDDALYDEFYDRDTPFTPGTGTTGAGRGG